MPELDGVAVVTALRALGNDIPICVLSARDTVNDRIAGLEAGADDYLTKPFDLGELVARLHALLRRASQSDQQSDTMTVGPLTIDTARRLVFVDGERVDLTKREFDLLAVLAENAGVVLSRQRLLELVWGYDFDVDTNVADVFISYLRRQARTRSAAAGHSHGSRDRVRAARRAVRARVPTARFGRSASLRTRVALAAAAAACRRRRGVHHPHLGGAGEQRRRAAGSAARFHRRRQHVSRSAVRSPPRRADDGAVPLHRAGGVPARLPAAALPRARRRSKSTASTTGSAPSRWISKAACWCRSASGPTASC